LVDVALQEDTMTANIPISAAQYLRMSTDHQQYSLVNQADAIAKYASDHGFVIVKTYSDAAKSGLRLRNRDGLKQLLKDVVEGQVSFRTILVYDVSRWGRFQDTDEAAHYEYLCKSSGIPVYYCAEQFTNDNSPAGLIMKALKRTMAGEYSRELSVKVRAGLFRLAKLGYKMGGSTPFAMRRQLIDVNGLAKQLLGYGQRKSIVNDRVILVPGPGEEVAIVERIFREFADGHKSLTAIAKGLNAEGIRFVTGNKWRVSSVTKVLRNPQYIGTQVWGRTTELLSGPSRKVPKDQWVVREHAFTPIISPELFQRAQEGFAEFTLHLSNEQLLERLRLVLRQHGKLNSQIIEESRSCPGLTTYRQRFGGLLNVYRRLGYSTPGVFLRTTSRHRGFLLRSALIADLLANFPLQLQEERKTNRHRTLLRYRKTGRLIAVVLAYQLLDSRGDISWRIDVPDTLRKRTVVVGFLDSANEAIQSLIVFDRLRLSKFTIRPNRDDEWLRSGYALHNISDFVNALEWITVGPKTKKPPEKHY
jgi:DNA invertase Pin-like site-specific DNA recombinase